MGACLSKKSTTTISKSTTPTLAPQEVKVKPSPEQPEKKKKKNECEAAIVVTEQEAFKKATNVKPRKSHEIERHPDQETPKSLDKKKNPNTTVITEISQSTTTSAAVLNGESGKAGGAAVRTSSCTKEEVDAILIQCGRLSRSSSADKAAGGRRYSGSKRSFDFDLEVGSKNDDEETAAADGGGNHRRHRQQEARVSSPSSSSRRRSRERDPQQQRSGSKERGSGGGRRVSRSPNRRSESPVPISGGGGSSNRPGKMVSVPATDKSGGGEVVAAGAGGGVKRIQVKRNLGEAGGLRPRSRSPARANYRVLNENQNQDPRQQPLSLSRSNSRKAEHSPYRRNPLSEIDNNAAAAAAAEQPPNKAQMHKPNGEKMINNKSNNVVATKNTISKEKHMTDSPGVEDLKPHQKVTRTRSSRLSRDLDINPESLLNPVPPSYASLLLEDIHNFHQKNTTTTTAAATVPPVSLPACVSKAQSIMDAVADLNSTTTSGHRKTQTTTASDNLVESEMVVNDDLMEPSLHKYVTVRRGVGDESEEQESSGSNSFAGSQPPNWLTSSWEPNSGDSTDCLTSSSKSNARENESGHKKRTDYPRNGIGRGRVSST